MKKLLPLLPLVGLVGCASLSSYQEARVLEKGKMQVFLGATGYQDDLKKQTVKVGSNLTATLDSSKGLTAFMGEVGFRVGVWEGLDLGLKYSVPGALNADVKYQLLGRDSASQFQLSAGLKGGYASLNGENSKGETVNGIPVIDVIVPVYATYAPVSWASLTVAPQYTFRISDNEYWYPGGSIVGGNVDLRLGKKSGIIGEVGYHRHLDKEYGIMNYGAVLYSPFELSDLLPDVVKSFL